MKKIYMITTEHLEDTLWFRDEEDFRVAMNYIAIEAARHPELSVLIFILMSNHTHFLLFGARTDVADFVNSFKARYSHYYQHKYGSKEFLRRNALDIREIPVYEETPEKAAAYIMMNCVAANICAHPFQYPWGCASIFFNRRPLHGRRLKDLSDRALKRILHSDENNLPGDWILGEDGYILPASYVDIKAVESLFRTPKRLDYFFSHSSKAKIRLEAQNNLPAFRDQTVLASVQDLCRSLFQKENFSQLTLEEQSEFARQIKFRFSADATQIARVCGITYAEAAKLLDMM